MRIFIIEDDHLRLNYLINQLDFATDSIHVGHSVEEALKMWQPPYDLVLFDHDLGGRTYVGSEDKNTGAEFARLLVHNKPGLYDLAQHFIVHSYNPDGAKNIVAILAQAGIQADYIPFGPALVKRINYLKTTL